MTELEHEKIKKELWNRLTNFFFIITSIFLTILLLLLIGYFYQNIKTHISPEKALIFLLSILFCMFLLMVIAWYLLKKLLNKANMSITQLLLETDDKSNIKTQEQIEIEKKWEDFTEKVNKSKRTSKYYNYFYNKPWIILIGEPKTGKTFSLRRSDLESVEGFDVKEKILNVRGTAGCDIWPTEKALIIDTAGKMLNQTEKEHERLWNTFLNNLSKWRPTRPIDAVIITISIESFIKKNNEEQQKEIDNITSRLYELKTNLQITFPVYIMISKLDLISGFDIFSKGLEANQVFGWSFKRKRDSYIDFSDFEEYFTELASASYMWFLKRMNDIDINRHEHEKIVNFLFKFQEIKSSLENYLKQIFYQSYKYFWRGCYFTTSIDKAYKLDLKKDYKFIITKSNDYFIKDFYRQKVCSEAGLVEPDLKATQEIKDKNIRNLCIFSFLLIVLITILFTVSHQLFSNFSIKDKVTEAESLLKKEHQTNKWEKLSYFLEKKAEYIENSYLPLLLLKFKAPGILAKNLRKTSCALKVKFYLRPFFNELDSFEKTELRNYIETLSLYIDIIVNKRLYEQTTDIDFEIDHYIKKATERIYQFWDSIGEFEYKRLEGSIEKTKNIYNQLINMDISYKNIQEIKLNIEKLKKCFQQLNDIIIEYSKIDPNKLKSECENSYHNLLKVFPPESNTPFYNSLLEEMTVCSEVYEKINKFRKRNLIENNRDFFKNDRFEISEDIQNIISILDTACIKEHYNQIKIKEFCESLKTDKQRVKLINEYVSKLNNIPIADKTISSPFFKYDKLISFAIAYQDILKKNLIYHYLLNALSHCWSNFITDENNIQYRDKFPFSRTGASDQNNGNTRTIDFDRSLSTNELKVFFTRNENGYSMIVQMHELLSIAKNMRLQRKGIPSKQINKIYSSCTNWKNFLFNSNDQSKNHTIDIQLHYIPNDAHENFNRIDIYSGTNDPLILYFDETRNRGSFSWKFDSNDQLRIKAIEEDSSVIDEMLKYSNIEVKSGLSLIAFAILNSRQSLYYEGNDRFLPIRLPNPNISKRLNIELIWINEAALPSIIGWPKLSNSLNPSCELLYNQIKGQNK